MESGRLSNIQAAMLAITALTIIGHLILLTVIIYQSRQDGWLAAIVGTVFGLVGILALVKLVQRFPGRTLIEILFNEFSWIGKLLGVVYLIYFYLMLTLGVRLFVEAYKRIMPETPAWAFEAIILLLTSYIVYKGLETLGRLNQIMLVVLVLFALVVAFLSMRQNKDYSNLLPIMGNGIQPVVVGALSVMGWFSEFAIMGMVLPYVKRPKNLMKTGLWTAIITLVFFLGPITGPIALFGPTDAAKMAFPTFSEVRYISAGEVINRFDAIAIMFWTVGLMIYISLFLYGLCLGSAQALKLKNYHPLVIPFAWLTSVGAYLFASNYAELNEFLFASYVPINILMGAVIPLLLLGWCIIRRKSMKSERQVTNL